jgi:hypothetical protein
MLGATDPCVALYAKLELNAPWQLVAKTGARARRGLAHQAPRAITPALALALRLAARLRGACTRVPPPRARAAAARRVGSCVAAARRACR